jgi:hypothetical protein
MRLADVLARDSKRVLHEYQSKALVLDKSVCDKALYLGLGLNIHRSQAEYSENRRYELLHCSFGG